MFFGCGSGSGDGTIHCLGIYLENSIINPGYIDGSGNGAGDGSGRGNIYDNGDGSGCADVLEYEL